MKPDPIKEWIMLATLPVITEHEKVLRQALGDSIQTIANLTETAAQWRERAQKSMHLLLRIEGEELPLPMMKDLQAGDDRDIRDKNNDMRIWTF